MPTLPGAAALPDAASAAAAASSTWRSLSLAWITNDFWRRGESWYSLVRMYSRYAETVGWKVSLLSESLAEMGGFKEAILEIKGDQVYSKLKFEAERKVHSTFTVTSMRNSDEIGIFHYVS
jgi:hypothetical protein